MRQLSLHLVAAGALALGAASARADVMVEFLDRAHGSVQVDFHILPGPLPGQNATSGSTGAGGFLTRLNGVDPIFTTYCIDLFQYIGLPASYPTGYTVVPGTSYTGFRNPNALSDLQKLYSAGHVVNDAITEGAFQLAVWEIVYETSGSYGLGANQGTAWFAADNADAATALSLANQWVSAGGLGSGNGWAITVLKSDVYQDEVFANRVPEPASLALAATALGVMGVVGRRRRSPTGR